MILEESNVLRITDHAQAKYRSICLIAIYSGLRLADIVSLCPKEVDLKEGWIRKYQGKTRNWVEIPICQKLKDVLSLLIWPIEKNQSFFHVAKTKAISTEILRACKRAGYQGHSFKSFCHFAGTFLVNAGVPIEIIKDFLTTVDTCSQIVLYEVHIVSNVLVVVVVDLHANRAMLTGTTYYIKGNL